MDPNATLRDIANYLMIQDTVAANGHCEILHDWLQNGGFEPNWSANKTASWYYQNYMNVFVAFI